MTGGGTKGVVLAVLMGATLLASSGGAGATTEGRLVPATSASFSDQRSTVSAPSGLLAFVTDSNLYASSGKETLATVRPDGENRQVLVGPASTNIGLLAFSPDGTRLAYFRATPSKATVDVIELSSRKVTVSFVLRNKKAFVDGIAWTPNGRDLIIGSNERPGSKGARSEAALWRMAVSGGTTTRLTPFEDAGSPSVSPDGDLVYCVSKTYSSTTLQKTALYISRPNGGGPRLLLKSRHFIDTPAVSPNGGEIAFTLVLNDNTSHLGSIMVTGRHWSNLTPSVRGRTDLSASWSPSGRSLVYLSSRAGRHASTKAEQLLDAYEMTATGKDSRKVDAVHGDTRSFVVIVWGR